MGGFGARGWSELHSSDWVGRDSTLHFEAVIRRYRSWSWMKWHSSRNFKVWIAVSFVELECGCSHLSPICLFLSNILCQFFILTSWHRFRIWKYILVFKIFLNIIWSCLILFNSFETWLFKDLSWGNRISSRNSCLRLTILFLQVLCFLIIFGVTRFQDLLCLPLLEVFDLMIISLKPLDSFAIFLFYYILWDFLILLDWGPSWAQMNCRSHRWWLT